jgi:hypothetical protein
MKLISMTDFVIEQDEKWCKDEFSTMDFIVRIRDYANFQKKKLCLGLFIPCDENDMQLPKPQIMSLNNAEYQIAKQKVLFKDFQVIYGDNCINFVSEKSNLIYQSDEGVFLNYDFEEVETIEEITYMELELTQTAKIILGL